MDHRFGQILQSGDVKDRNTGEVFGNAIRIKAQADFDDVFFHEGHVVVGDIMMGAIGETDPKRLERFRPKQVTNLYRCDHGRNMSGGSGIANGASAMGHRKRKMTSPTIPAQ